MQENERGKNYWQFNYSLLQDKDYVKVVKYVIKETIETYKSNNNNNNIRNGDNISKDNAQFAINDQLLLEILGIAITPRNHFSLTEI